MTGGTHPTKKTSQILPNFPTMMNSIEAAWKASNYGSHICTSGEPQGPVLPPLYNYRYCECSRCQNDLGLSSKTSPVPRRNEGGPESNSKKRPISSSPRAVCNPNGNHFVSRSAENVIAHKSPMSSVSTNIECEKYWNVVMNSMTGNVESRSQKVGHQNGLSVKDPTLIPNEDPQQKPFRCPTCSMRFRKRCNLLTHISNVHEKLKPFFCPICLRHFARKSNCGKHVS